MADIDPRPVDPTIVEKAARAIADSQACGYCEGDCGQCVSDATAVLEAVADDLRAEGAVKALRDFAGAMECDDWTHRDDWGVKHAYAVEVRARADAIEAGRSPDLPLHRTEAGYPNCSTCDGGGCPDCTDPAC